jgi:hypothetical protein
MGYAMFRSLILLVLTGCLVAQTTAPPAQEQAPAELAPAEAPKPPVKYTPSGPVKTGFPFDNFKDFSAIMVGSVLPGDDRENHIYRSGNFLRTEGPEGHGYVLSDLTSFETYSLNRFGCMHDQHPYFRSFPFSASRRGRKIERVSVGTETIEGHVCQIEEVTITSRELMKPMVLRFWEAEDLQGFPIKVEVVRGGVPGAIAYKDVVLGPQDAKLFEHPKECKGTVPQFPAKKSSAPKKPKAPAAGSALQ